MLNSQKKVRKESKAEASAQMPEVIPSGTKEQDEEEEEEKAVLSLHPRCLRSRGPAVLPEVEPACLSTMAEGAVIAE